MKVFISWSGSTAHEAALLLRETLPDLINVLRPFVSSEDIAKGERGIAKIEENLQDAGFGIICLTPHSLESPWVNFEAGAMANKITAIRIAPILIGLDSADISGSPLTSFQYTPIINAGEMLKLTQSVLEACPEPGLDSDRLKKNFSRHWWSDFETRAREISSRVGDEAGARKVPVDEKIDELLGIARRNQRRIDRVESTFGMGADWMLPTIPEWIYPKRRRSRPSVPGTRVSAPEAVVEVASILNTTVGPGDEIFTPGKNIVFTDDDRVVVDYRDPRSISDNIKEDLSRVAYHTGIEVDLEGSDVRLEFTPSHANPYPEPRTLGKPHGQEASEGGDLWGK